MKCENCSHVNSEDSIFCENCGERLVNKKLTIKTHKSQIADELSEVIFTPKKESHGIRNIIIALVIIFVIIIVLLILRDGNNNSNATSGTYSATPTPNVDSNGNSFDVSCLELSDEKMYSNSYYNQNPTYKATIHNGCSQAVENVVIKINFFHYGAPAGAVPVDTEYIKVASFLDQGDSSSIDMTVQTNADTSTSTSFNWNSEVYTATPL